LLGWRSSNLWIAWDCALIAKSAAVIKRLSVSDALVHPPVLGSGSGVQTATDAQRLAKKMKGIWFMGDAEKSPNV
jgi:hypothetical protein